MRIMKVLIVALLAAFALVTGLFAALALGAVSAVRALKRGFSGAPARSAQPAPRRRVSRKPAIAPDVIDVSATEVSAEPLQK